MDSYTVARLRAIQSVARMGNIPHGNSLLAQGSAIKVDPFDGNPFGPDKVAAANTAPFPVDDAFPATATPQDQVRGCLCPARFPDSLLGFLQPNARVSKLSDDRRKCPSQVFPGAGGGIENIPSLQTNADVATMFATFWIEEISASSMGRRQRSTTVTIAGLSVVSGSASSRRWRPPAPFPASFQSTAATSKPIAWRAAQKGEV